MFRTNNSFFNNILTISPISDFFLLAARYSQRAKFTGTICLSIVELSIKKISSLTKRSYSNSPTPNFLVNTKHDRRKKRLAFSSDKTRTTRIIRILHTQSVTHSGRKSQIHHIHDFKASNIPVHSIFNHFKQAIFT